MHLNICKSTDVVLGLFYILPFTFPQVVLFRIKQRELQDIFYIFYAWLHSKNYRIFLYFLCMIALAIPNEK